MNIRGKKFLTLCLVFCLMAFSGNLTAQERKGVMIRVETDDGQTISGELISVKRDSLLLLDSESNADLSLNIAVVKTIKVFNKARMLELGVLGGLVGAGIQGLQGTEVVDSSAHWEENPVKQSKIGFFEYAAIAGGVGVLLGAVVGIDKTIQIQGRSDAEIQEALKKLSKKARFRGFQ